LTGLLFFETRGAPFFFQINSKLDTGHRTLKLTRIDIIEDLAKEFPETSEVKLRLILNALIHTIKNRLINNDSVHFAEFGNFVATVHKPKRVVSNMNGSVVITPTRRSAKFRISRYFRNELNNGGEE
jgi:nucleoid DNA-binding protein